MKPLWIGAFAVAAVSLGSACTSAPQPAVRAAGVEKMQCDPNASSRDDVVRSLAVLHVEPVYSRVLTTGSTEDRVNGAKLVVRPPKDVSAEQLTRILQCHGARALLGQLSGTPAANDPYWLPERWVNIEVRPENGNFAVFLSTDTTRDNLQVYGRATHYGDEHMVATDPGLP